MERKGRKRHCLVDKKAGQRNADAGTRRQQQHQLTNGTTAGNNSSVASVANNVSQAVVKRPRYAAQQTIKYLKEWVRERLDCLVCNQKEATIDEEMVEPLLKTVREEEREGLREKSPFWFVYLSSVVTQLRTTCSATFEATANWLHYATVQLMNETPPCKLELLPVTDLKDYLHFLIKALREAERRVKQSKAAADGGGANYHPQPVNMLMGPLFGGTYLQWTMDSTGFALAILPQSPLSGPADDPVVRFESTRLKAIIPGETSAAQRKALKAKNDQVMEQTAVLYRRNATMVMAVAIALVESAQQMVELLKDGNGNSSVIVNFLLNNIRRVAEKMQEQSGSESAKRNRTAFVVSLDSKDPNFNATSNLPPSPPIPVDVDHLNTAIFSVVALFRVFSDLKQADLVAIAGVSHWKDLPWVSLYNFQLELESLVQSGGSGGKTTAASATFAVFSRAERTRLMGEIGVCSLKRRLLLLLQCLSEATLRQLDCSWRLFPRDSAFEVLQPPPPPSLPPTNLQTMFLRKGEEKRAEETSVIHPPLSVGYFAYGTDDVRLQPYQWRCPFPLIPATTTTATTTQNYYTEVFLLTSGSMNIGFYFDGFDVGSASPAAAIAADAAVQKLSKKKKALTTAAVPAAAVFYNPSSGDLIVNGHELSTNMQVQTEGSPIGEQSIIIGVLLETGITTDMVTSEHSISAQASSSTTAAAAATSKQYSPTFYLDSHQAAVTFFVNTLKVEIISSPKKRKVCKGKAIKSQYDKEIWQRFLSKFSGSLAKCPPEAAAASAPSAVFIVALAGYQATLVHRFYRSWHFAAESRITLYNGAINKQWTGFPVRKAHKDLEVFEQCRLKGFQVGAQLDSAWFKQKFCSKNASYEIESQQGQGGYGTVFLCNQRKLVNGNEKEAQARQVAIKVLQFESTYQLVSIERETAFLDLIKNNKVSQN